MKMRINKKGKKRSPQNKISVSFLKHEIVTTEVAQARFDAIEEGQVVDNRDHTQHYTFNHKYQWRCAWSDKTLAHMQLPTYWFVNEVGDVISVKYKNPRYLKQDTKNKTKYAKYHFTMPNGQKKVIAVHNLVGLVFDSPMTIEAEYLLNTKGLKAFGTRIGDVNGHHIDGDITSFDWDNTEFIIKRPHNDMHEKRYDQIAQNAVVPTIIITPYEFDKDANYLRHGSINSLRELSLEELSETLKNVVAVSEILIDDGEKKHILKLNPVVQDQ